MCTTTWAVDWQQKSCAHDFFFEFFLLNKTPNVFKCYNMTYYMSQILEITHRAPFTKSRDILVTILLQSCYNNVLMSLLSNDNVIVPNMPALLVKVFEP